MFSLFCLVSDFPYLLIFFCFSDKPALRFIDLSILEFMYCQFYLYSLFQSSWWSLHHTYQFAWDILVFAYCPNTFSSNTPSFQKCIRKVKAAQSCPTLYGILQARILVWVALSSLCVCVCVHFEQEWLSHKFDHSFSWVAPYDLDWGPCQGWAGGTEKVRKRAAGCEP